MMDGSEKEADANSPYEVGERETMNTHGPDLQGLFVTDRRRSSALTEDQTVRLVYPTQQLDGILDSPCPSI